MMSRTCAVLRWVKTGKWSSSQRKAVAVFQSNSLLTFFTMFICLLSEMTASTRLVGALWRWINEPRSLIELQLKKAMENTLDVSWRKVTLSSFLASVRSNRCSAQHGLIRSIVYRTRAGFFKHTHSAFKSQEDRSIFPYASFHATCPRARRRWFPPRKLISQKRKMWRKGNVTLVVIAGMLRQKPGWSLLNSSRSQWCTGSTSSLDSWSHNSKLFAKT